jgi:asparagine synthase (glutamine-hydrolysing)
MLQSIQHRGPDDDGVYIDTDLAIGMRRLSIIDLEGGKQPIHNEDGSVTVVFNGEIYNYRELTRHLQERGHVFTTHSDSEVLVHLYEEYGSECVHRLRGMFAFAIWDARTRSLLLMRDRLGIKPLYYSILGQRLVFASEIKALLCHPGIPARMDMEGLSSYLSLRYVPSPRTMFADIASLPPGHMLQCTEAGIVVRAYWDISFAPENTPALSEAEYTEQLETILRDSVHAHLVSDVPFGAFLSGGVDSSTIVALMSQFLDEPVKTFSVGFQGAGEANYSELSFARLAAEHYQTEHREIIIDAQDFIDHTERICWHLDQPVADTAVLGIYLLSSLAAEHVKMVLVGEGGDELFAGYTRYAGERFSPLFRHLPERVRATMIRASNMLPGARRPKQALFALCQSDEVTRIANWLPLFNAERKAALWSDSLLPVINQHAEIDAVAQHLAQTNATNWLHRMLYVDSKLWLADYLLARGDKLSMAASLECRVPFLDHTLVEFAASLPPHLKLNRLTQKYLLKKVAYKWLPPATIQRKKQGFPMPTAIWFRNEARSFMRDILAPDTIKRRGLFNPQYVEQLLREHESGRADHAVLLFGLINIELWQRHFIDQHTALHHVNEPARLVG